MSEPTPWEKKTFWEKVQSIIGVVFRLVVAVGMIFGGIEEYQKFPVGAHVFTSREVYGMSDLDRAYDALTKAREAKDEYGLAELAEQERAILFPKDTFGLVLEGELKGTTMYRNVRRWVSA